MSDEPFRYGEERLTAGRALALAGGSARGVIGAGAADRIDRSAGHVEAIVASDRAVYGVNTGFGPLCTTRIAAADLRRLQENLLRSHSCGIGDDAPLAISRLMLVLKVQALAQGYSGIARATLDRMLWHLDQDVIPVVPSQGSAGASGDLAPLAHLFLPLIGLGRVVVGGVVREAGAVLAERGLGPLTLAPKEGLALINGTQFIAAHAVAAVERLQSLLDQADLVGAMSLEALLGSARPFARELHELRPFAGCRHVAHRLCALLQGSAMVASHEHCGRVQDPYSLRCMPQVHGASRNAWLHLRDLTAIEINSVTDNPILLDRERALSGGNFHGQPLALPLDYATVAASELGNISDRRTYLLLEGHQGILPKLLMTELGVNSGFMIPQYTSAALASENKSLCFPASADSIPTSLGQEDHVSMGSVSGRKLHRVLDNLESILAVELVCAAQAFDFRRPLASSPILDACHRRVRERIDHASEDRVFHDDLLAARALIRERVLVEESRRAAGEHGIDLDGDGHELFGVF